MTEPLDQDVGNAGILVGERLRAAREAEGLSVQELSGRLCLSARQVEALENGDLDKLPGKTFIRGIVRNYANLVHLDAEPLLSLLDQIKNLVTPKLAPPESTRVVIPSTRQSISKGQSGLIVAGILLVTLAVALYFLAPFLGLSEVWSSGQNDARHHDSTLELPLVMPSSGFDILAPSSLAASPSGTPLTLPTQNTESITPPEFPVKEEPRTLQFLFSGEAWIEVRDKDNRILVSGIFAAKQTQAVSGWPPFSVTVGDATRVKLYDEDKEVPLKPASDRTARVRLP